MNSTYAGLFHRVFSRIAVIPFKRFDKKQSLENSLHLQVKLKPLMDTAFCSAFKAMRTNNLFKEVLSLSDNIDGLGLRTRFNYVLLMFLTRKVG